MSIVLLLFIVLISLLTGCKKQLIEMNRFLDAAHENWSFDGVVLVAYKGRVVLNKGYGLADLRAGQPNLPDTRFFIGSITKQFTATAIMILYQEGKLDLDDPIIKYIPEYPEKNGSIITINHLLTHTSGIPDYTIDPEIALQRTQPMKPMEIMATFMYKPLEFEPGTAFQYSNSGYVLLGIIIERISGQSYEAFLHKRIFNPLGMHNSGYARREAGIPNRAEGYTYDEVEGDIVEAVPIHFSVLYAAGALYSNAADMFLWDQDLYRDDILSPASLDKMLTPHLNQYGYGWVIEQRFNHRHTYHGGFLDGFNTYFSRWPDDSLCIVVFSNDDVAPVNKIAHGLAAIVFGADYVFPIRKKPGELDPRQIHEYTGVYQFGEDQYRIISEEQGRLFSHILGHPKECLKPEKKDSFFYDFDNTRTVVFKRNDENAITGMVIIDENIQYTGKKLPPEEARRFVQNRQVVKLHPEILQRYAGVYLLKSGADQQLTKFKITVEVVNNNLEVSSPQGTVVLQPSAVNVFYLEGSDYQLTFTLSMKGKVVGCILRSGPAEVLGLKIR